LFNRKFVCSTRIALPALLAGPRLDAAESLKKSVERFGELRLLKKRRQFQKRVPDSPRQWNADDEPVNEKFEPVIGRLIALSHGKRSAYGYRFCL
jgi:hypothetical protein